MQQYIFILLERKIRFFLKATDIFSYIKMLEERGQKSY